MAWGLTSSSLNKTAASTYISKLLQTLAPALRNQATQTTALSFTAATAIILSIWYWRPMAALALLSSTDSHDPRKTDPDLLKNNSEIKSFTTSRFTYTGIRVFFKPHSRLNELPSEPAPLPLLVFVHGLGGSVAQFHPLLCSLTHNSSCLAVDLPGCGVSELSPSSWEAYSQEALAELLETIINGYRDREAGQGVVLIGHSMGCGLSARLAAPGLSKVAAHVVGFVAICPPAGPPTEEQVKAFRKLLWIPGPIFDLWRAWDAWGGTESASVKRFLGDEADMESKKSQYRYNRQSRTPTFRRVASGCLPRYENGNPRGGLAGKDVWTTLNVPVFLLAGGKDHATPTKNIEKIAEYLKDQVPVSPNGASGTAQPGQDQTAPALTSGRPPSPTGSIRDIKEEDFRQERKTQLGGDDDAHEDLSTPHELSTVIVPPQPAHPAKVVKSLVIPRGTHGMIFTPDCSHILASVIADFLSQHVTGRLSRSWQLQYLNKEGKWELKNLTKWKGVQPVSDSIAGVFRVMKTMREVDDEHSPTKFAEKWGHIVKDVIDISKDAPVYDPAGLERAGIRYHKFPTVSKIPPTDDEVNRFIALVDRLRKEQETRALEEGWGDEGEHAIAVHCHYGFNRSPYFVICYLVERFGYEVQQALDAFAKARPNGIKHSHFKDHLFVRYSELRTQEGS